MEPVSADFFTEMTSDRTLTEASGAKRIEGQIVITADERFDTASMRYLSSEPELLIESKPGRGGYRVIALRVPEVELATVLASVRVAPGVLAADKNMIFEPTLVPNDPRWADQKATGLALMGLENAWDVSRGIPSVKIAVLDYGVNAVPDLFPQILQGKNFLVLPPGDDVTDYLIGHGTSVASIIGATMNNSTSISGVSPGARIVPLKVCNPVSQCVGFIVALGLQWVFDSGDIDVVNMSFRTDNEANVEAWLKLVDEWHGTISVASAGNFGTNGVVFPANSEHAVAVAGTTSTGARHPSSSYGQELDVAAPYELLALNMIGLVVLFPGTSAAAPAIAGLAALFKSTWPEEMSDRSWFMYAIENFGKAHEKDNQTGYGVPNAFNTIYARACFRYDVTGDDFIDVSDDQRFAFRYGARYGQPDYSLLYDVNPPLAPDGWITITDLQRVFGPHHMHCPS